MNEWSVIAVVLLGLVCGGCLDGTETRVRVTSTITATEENLEP